MKNYTIEYKIDYIFDELKNQKKIRIIKTVFKILLVGLIIYSYYIFIYGLKKDEIMTNISSFIGKIVQPITENIVNDMVEKKTFDINNISSEMIDKLIKNTN